MTKYKCDNCGEKHDRIHIVIECTDCYVNGIIKELTKVFKEEMERRAKNETRRNV